MYNNIFIEQRKWELLNQQVKMLYQAIVITFHTTLLSERTKISLSLDIVFNMRYISLYQSRRMLSVNYYFKQWGLHEWSKF